jgi:hypothetical protein
MKIRRKRKTAKPPEGRRCEAITLAGTRCTFPAHDGRRCRLHRLKPPSTPAAA